MKQLNTKEMNRIFGLGVGLGYCIEVTGRSFYTFSNGYRYYADHVKDPGGMTIFKGAAGSFRMSDGIFVTVGRASNVKGNLYTMASWSEKSYY